MDIRFYLLLAALLCMIAVSAATLNPAIIAVSAVLSSFAIASYKLDYLIDSVVFRRTSLVQVLGECSLSGDRRAAIREINGRFCATAAAVLRGRPDSPISNSGIEGIVSNSNCAFRLVLGVERIDMKRLVEGLETNRIKCEIAMGRLEASGSQRHRIDALKRRIAMISDELEAITTGGAPLKLSNYIVTSAMSETKAGAQERARSQIRELAGEFGAATGCSAAILEGNELLELVKFNACV